MDECRLCYCYFVGEVTWQFTIKITACLKGEKLDPFCVAIIEKKNVYRWLRRRSSSEHAENLDEKTKIMEESCSS